MEFAKGDSISQIQSIPGLFISDRHAAHSLPLLKDNNITSILSVTWSKDCPDFSSLKKETISQKYINIDDNSTTDILVHLKDACDWIEVALQRNADKESENNEGVLVHCTQGVSRSGTIAIAYLMRSKNLPYSEALALARESRPLITPNPGFEYQLGVWHQCDYDVHSENGEEKAAYKACKKKRDQLLERGEEVVNRAMFANMASAAAAFAKRRNLGAGSGQGEGNGEGSGGKTEGWQKVEEMEKDWTRRLTRGEDPPWKDKKEERGSK